MDIVIVSNGKNNYLRTVTKHAIDSCKRSSLLINFNFIIVEQAQRVTYKYPGVKTVHYNFPFNYNRCLNLGFKYSTTKYVAFCNNDLDFYSHWSENIIQSMGETIEIDGKKIYRDKYLSASPTRYRQRHGIKETYEIGRGLNGWCIVINRALMDIIGGFDTGVKFWYSDDIYADQLKSKGIKHILCNYSVVNHLGSRTLRGGHGGKDLMRSQRKNYIEARKKYHK